MRKLKFMITSWMLLTGLVSAAEMVDSAVKNFDLDRYLGTWYEIARLDHSFERGLSQVTATYSLKDNGMVRVLNRGYSDKKSNWRSATGVAKFTGDVHVGALRVSFFRPFYGGYNVVSLAEDYSYALVAGDSNKYLWILARSPELPVDIVAGLMDKARSLGYDTDALIFVDQVRNK